MCFTWQHAFLLHQISNYFKILMHVLIGILKKAKEV